MNENIREWVLNHKVCWESLPYWVADGPKKLQVGFEIHLFAQHEPEVKADPGCKKCQEVYKGLHTIAMSAIPTHKDPTRFEISTFDASFHLRPENNFKAEVQLTILILHGEQFIDPVNECEKKCLNEIEQNLRNLGIKPRVWFEPNEGELASVRNWSRKVTNSKEGFDSKP